MNSLLTKLADEEEKKEKPPFIKNNKEEKKPKDESKKDKSNGESPEPTANKTTTSQDEADPEIPKPQNGQPPIPENGEEQVPAPKEEVAPMVEAPAKPVGIIAVINFLQQNPAPGPEIYQLVENAGISKDEFYNSIHSLASKFVNFLRGGYMIDKGFDISTVNQNELNLGIKVEYEHAADEAIAKKIAMDHLADLPDYYTRLQKMLAEGHAEIDAAAVPVNTLEEDNVGNGISSETIQQENVNGPAYNMSTSDSY